MAIHQVQIIADCDSIVSMWTKTPNANPPAQIQMFADPAIVYKNQGNYELGIVVNQEDVIRWSIFPKITQPVGSGSDYSVIITQRFDWTNDPTKTLLTGWTGYQGYTSIWTYTNNGEVMGQNQSIPVMKASDYLPYVEATAAVPGRPDPGTTSPEEAYTFTINIYRGNSSTPVVEGYRWDPFVKVAIPS